jgi:hypothetical protein
MKLWHALVIRGEHRRQAVVAPPGAPAHVPPRSGDGA